MMSERKTILFFSPFFGYTGSEIMLLELIKGLDKTVYSPHIYLFNRGELSNEIPGDIPCYFPQVKKKTWKTRIMKKLGKKYPAYNLQKHLSQIQQSIQADLWYANTIAIPAEVYEIASSLKVKIVTHVHELIYAYGFFPEINLKNIITYSYRIIGCSKAVCNSIKDIGISNVHLQYNFINIEKIENALTQNSITRSVFGIEKDEFVWVVSARSTFLKGIDYLKQILMEMGDAKYRIIWIGSTEGTSLSFYMETWIKLHFPKKVIFTGKHVEKYYNYLSMGDGFLIPSREESFSLVAVEATYLGLPIVSFDYGAAEEIIDVKNGIIVRSWNVSDLIDAMKKVMAEKNPLHIKIKNSKFPFKKEIQLPKFNKLLDQITNNY